MEDTTITDPNETTVLADLTASPTLNVIDMPHELSPGSVSRAPGVTSPIRGKTFKEYDELLAQYKRENFDFKLRIYFLEERLSKIRDLKDKEDIIKRNVALEVEKQVLRNEVEEKQELLRKAAKALAVFEKQDKETKEEKSKLEEKVKSLEKQLHESENVIQQLRASAMCQSTDSQFSFGFDTDMQELQDQLQQKSDTVHRLEGAILKFEKENRDQKKHIESLENNQLSLKALIMEMEDNAQESQARLSITKSDLDKMKCKLSASSSEIEKLKAELQTVKSRPCEMCGIAKEEKTSLLKSLQKVLKEVAIKNEKIKQLEAEKEAGFPEEDEIRKIKESAEEQERESEQHLESVRASLLEKEAQLVACEQRLEAKISYINNLEEQIESLRSQIKNYQHDNMVENEPKNRVSEDLLRAELEDRNIQVGKLENELKKRTYNLQELVNKELWDKNKHIERLELRLTALVTQCEKKEQELQVAHRKLSTVGLDEESAGVKEHVNAIQKVDELPEKSRSPESKEETELLKEVERNQLWRKGASIALCALRERLEELATFLDELMQQPNVVAKLSTDRHQTLRTVVEESLELSKSVVNLSGGPLNKLEKSDISLSLLIQAANDLSLVDKFQNVTTTPKLPEVTYALSDQSNLDSAFNFATPQSDELDQTQLVSRLRSQIGILTEAVKQRDIELARLQTEKMDPIPLSSSDLELDPDSVQEEKLDLQSRSDFLRKNAKDQSESETWSEPDRDVSQARMGIHDENSRTMCASGSSAPSTVRKKLVSSQNEASSSSSDIRKPARDLGNCFVGDESARVEHVYELPSRSHSLDQLDQVLRSELHIYKQYTMTFPPGILERSSDILNKHERELDQRPNGSGSLTESLNWSEPDRDVSQARIGIQEDVLRKRPVAIYQVNPTGAKKSSRSGGKRSRGGGSGKSHAGEVLVETESDLEEQVTILKLRLQAKEEELAQLRRTLLALQKEADSKDQQVNETKRNLENKLLELGVQVLEVELRRDQAEQAVERIQQESDQARRESEKKLSALEQMLSDAKKEIAQLEADLEKARKKNAEDMARISEYKAKIEELENVNIDLEKDSEDWKKMARKLEEDIKEIQTRLSREFKKKLYVFEQLKEASERRAEDWRNKYQDAESKRGEADQRLKDKILLMEEQSKLKQAEIERCAEERLELYKAECEKKNAKKIREVVDSKVQELDSQRRVISDNILRNRIESLEKKVADTSSEAEQRIREVEEKYRVNENNLKSRLDEASVTTSQAQLEAAKLANDRLQLEQQVRWLQAEFQRERKQIHEQYTQKLASLTEANTELHRRLKELEREVQHHSRKKASGQQGRSSSPDGKVLTEITNLSRQRSSDMSDYVSEEADPSLYPAGPLSYWYRDDIDPRISSRGAHLPSSLTTGSRRTCTASPDLGIESDQGRFSSLEAHPILKSTTAPALHTPEGVATALEIRKKQQLDYTGLEQENVELKKHLEHTRRTLEQIYAQLGAANQRKRIVEKAISKQLHKTNHILSLARYNFQSYAPNSDEQST